MQFYSSQVGRLYKLPNSTPAVMAALAIKDGKRFGSGTTLRTALIETIFDDLTKRGIW